MTISTLDAEARPAGRRPAEGHRRPADRASDRRCREQFRQTGRCLSRARPAGRPHQCRRRRAGPHRAIPSRRANFRRAGPISSPNSTGGPATMSSPSGRWGAFTNTDLEKYLRDAGVTQVVVAGVATSAGVEFHRPPRPRTRLQRRARRRCHDRHGRRRSPQQRHADLSEDGRDRHHAADHRSARAASHGKKEAPEHGWLHYLAYFGGGAFLTNAVPHLVSGVMGRPFQSPFAKPPGEGLFVLDRQCAVGLLQSGRRIRAGLPRRRFRSARHDDAIALGLGTASVRPRSRRGIFGRFHGGNTPRQGGAIVLKGTFRSLRKLNYRIWAAGALVSNVGTWMQRTAQDWIVLTELTAPAMRPRWES